MKEKWYTERGEQKLRQLCWDAAWLTACGGELRLAQQRQMEGNGRTAAEPERRKWNGSTRYGTVPDRCETESRSPHLTLGRRVLPSGKVDSVVALAPSIW